MAWPISCAATPIYDRTEGVTSNMVEAGKLNNAAQVGVWGKITMDGLCIDQRRASEFCKQTERGAERYLLDLCPRK